MTLKASKKLARDFERLHLNAWQKPTPVYKAMRIKAGFGLREFIEKVGIDPGDYIRIERDEKQPTAGQQKQIECFLSYVSGKGKAKAFAEHKQLRHGIRVWWNAPCESYRVEETDEMSARGWRLLKVHVLKAGSQFLPTQEEIEAGGCSYTVGEDNHEN